jgi:hypothetical protein
VKMYQQATQQRSCHRIKTCRINFDPRKVKKKFFFSHFHLVLNIFSVTVANQFTVQQWIAGDVEESPLKLRKYYVRKHPPSGQPNRKTSLPLSNLAIDHRLKQPVGIFVKNKRLDGFHCEAGCDTSNQTWMTHICSSFFLGNRHNQTCLLPILHVKRENWNPTALKKGLSTSRQHKPSSKFTFFETQKVNSKRLHVQ